MNQAQRSDLPTPALARWQPLRLGLVELYRYDAEEFWFRDGHLLLRGNNGTGKSKVLSLTLPLLLDASLRPARLEPDGDAGKKMAWNLLLGDAYPRRTGYSWIEFGRIGADGLAQYLTLGVGLHAVAARPQVDAWYFVVEQQRLGQDLWLTNAQRQVLTRERLRETLANGDPETGLAGRGQVFDSADAYRRAVDERLYQLGASRYAALMDTLIQLRQPQLSRRPDDERGLSSALTESLAPLPQDLLADVAEAMTQLEDERRQLEDTQRLHAAVQRFDQRYRQYAGMASRRQARELRQAQTEHDTASRARHEAQAAGSTARAQELAATARSERAERTLVGRRQQLDTLLADPLNGAALRLDEAARDARRRDDQAAQAEQDHQDARADAAREARRLREQQQRAEASEHEWAQARQRSAALADDVGQRAAWLAHRYAQTDAATLALLEAKDLERGQGELLALPTRRREQVQLLRRRLAACNEAQREHQRQQHALAERQAECEEAAAQRAVADDAVDRAGQAHVQAWSEHAGALRELPLVVEPLLAQLADWVLHASGDHPLHAALRIAQGQAVQRLAESRLLRDQQARVLADEQATLEQERTRLQAGVDEHPSPPPWRGNDTRRPQEGAALWQLLDFDRSLAAPERAALEAGLHASGLLDAWVTPDGQLLHGPQGQPWLDAQALPRAPVAGPSLAQVLHAAAPADRSGSAALVQRLLASLACSADDDGSAEAWFALDGRFRLAGLSGVAQSPAARYIGHAARLAARQRRLQAIAARQAEIDTALQVLQRESQALDAAAARIDWEWQHAPSDQALHQAHDSAARRARDLRAQLARVAEAEPRCRAAADAEQLARRTLEHDATDLHLSADAAGLDATDQALHAWAETLHRLAAAVRVLGSTLPERARQHEREAEASRRLATRAMQRQAALAEQESARSRLAALNAAHGDDVQGLRQRIGRARSLVQRVEQACKTYDAALRGATEVRARAEQRADSAEQQFTQRVQTRLLAVERLRAFAATGLLASALADADLPDPRDAWTIDPALSLARRIEQALATLDDSDERWKRVQQQVTEELVELQRSLSALGHQAAAETTDFGFVVHVQYRNQPERPEQLARILAADLAERQALLTAREREVLENHLQAEIAAEIQRLMRSAATQVEAINRELHKRPTSTGVRFRLLWQALPEGEGAPVGLHAARERLLHTRAELWSADDRRVLGRLLQQRIQDERQRSDLEAEGSLLEQLARALDYRRWHQFRVERLQDGQWRKLSGPASSGERALGLTVPLFAAVASFYGSRPLAPRLMLLDEAFAGIDDAARAHIAWAWCASSTSTS